MASPARKPENMDASAEALLKQALEAGDKAAEKLRDIVRLADALIAVLPPERRGLYIESIRQLHSLARSEGRIDAINDNIIALIKGREAITVSEVRNALIEQGLSVDQKRVANSLDYLVRCERLERVGRGQYRILIDRISNGAGTHSTRSGRYRRKPVPSGDCCLSLEAA